MRNKKAFTLIELVSVLVILAILALIVTPLVLNIIRKARTAADKRSIDAYGRSIELAIADYLLENGTFPPSIEQLTIEYTGDRVVCSITQLNSDSSVYLAECTVNSRAVTGYTYGKEDAVTYDAYNVGDEVTYNNVDYYVIKNSDVTEENVTLLKAEPLTVVEVNEYGAGHVNMYVTSDTSAPYYQTASDQNGYGGMAYYSSTSCGYSGTSSCITNYSDSEINYVVDAWVEAEAPSASEARLMTFDEMLNLGYDKSDKTCTPRCRYSLNSDIPTWLYDDNYDYWTMSQVDSEIFVWYVNRTGTLMGNNVNIIDFVVRPVIIISKSLLN